MQPGELSNFAAGYFNQDFEEIHGEPDDVIEAFKRDANDEELRSLLEEVASLLRQSPTEAELGVLWLKVMHSSFDPADDGYTYRGWFEHVRDVLNG